MPARGPAWQVFRVRGLHKPSPRPCGEVTGPKRLPDGPPGTLHAGSGFAVYAIIPSLLSPWYQLGRSRSSEALTRSWLVGLAAAPVAEMQPVALALAAAVPCSYAVL